MGMEMTLIHLVILTTIECFALIMLICKASDKDLFSYFKPVLLYIPIYVGIVLSRMYVHDFITLAILSVSIVILIKWVFNNKLGTSMLICLITMVLSIVVFQTLAAFALGLFLARPIGFAFNYGLVVMGATLVMCILCYVHIPLDKLIRRLKETDKYMYFIAAFFAMLIIVYLISFSGHFELLNERRPIINMLLSMGFAFTAIAIFYPIIKFHIELREKNLALKEIKKLEALPIGQNINLHGNYEKYLQVVYWLSYLYESSDYRKAARYIKKHLNSFINGEEEYYSFYNLQPELCMLDNSVLATYLYVKTKHLQSLGITCSLHINHHSTTSKIKTCKLIKSLDILIDEALSASHAERSDLRITVDCYNGGIPFIDISNRNEAITHKDTALMLGEEYSFKTKKIRGLRKLYAIIEEYDCYLSFIETKENGNDYITFRYSLAVPKFENIFSDFH